MDVWGGSQQLDPGRGIQARGEIQRWSPEFGKLKSATLLLDVTHRLQPERRILACTSLRFPAHTHPNNADSKHKADSQHRWLQGSVCVLAWRGRLIERKWMWISDTLEFTFPGKNTQRTFQRLCVWCHQCEVFSLSLALSAWPSICVSIKKPRKNYWKWHVCH